MRPEIEDVLQATAEEHDVPVGFITQDRQLMTITKVRHVAQYLCRQYTRSSLKEIGKKIGGRSHGMVTQAYQKIANECEIYDDTRSLVEDIEENLRDKGFTLLGVIRQHDVAWYEGGHNYSA